MLVATPESYFMSAFLRRKRQDVISDYGIHQSKYAKPVALIRLIGNLNCNPNFRMKWKSAKDYD